MKTRTLLAIALCLNVSFTSVPARADENFDLLKRELDALKQRVAALEDENLRLKKKELEVERLVVRKELIVSDTGNDVGERL